MRFGTDGQRERRVRSIEQALSHLEIDSVEGAPPAIIETRDAADVVIGEGNPDLEADALVRRELGPKLAFEGRIGPVALAKSADGLRLDFLLAKFADIRPRGEPKNELCVYFFGTATGAFTFAGAAQEGRERQCRDGEGRDPFACIHGAHATSSSR